MAEIAESKTAYVLAGGGSFGAVQVGMLRELTAYGVRPDLVIGSSVGAINGAHFAAAPTVDGVARLEKIWRELSRRDIFPLTWRSMLGLFRHSDYLVDPRGLRSILELHLPIKELEEATIPVHAVATNFLGGGTVRLSAGSAVEAILASAAIPGAFPPVHIGEDYLVDGAVSSNTPIVTAMELGATRIIVFPTGFACDLRGPPRGAIASALHALTLLVARHLVGDMEQLRAKVELVTIPPLCPLSISPFDFSRAGELIERGAESTRRWLDKNGLRRHSIPSALRAHDH
jgi:NTE family protein